MPSNNDVIWNKCLSIIEECVNPASFNAWFRGTQGLPSNDSLLIIKVKNQYIADWLEQHYLELILRTVENVFCEPLPIAFAYPNANELTITMADTSRLYRYSENTADTDRHLNPRYSFDTFVVGEFNQMAYTAAISVAEMPGKTKYNPLYIYGGVGLGKTHLLQAIGNYIKQNSPSTKVVYVTSEKFTREYIDSLKNKTTSEFQKFYRSADILLVDDIQFFSGKESIQNEFFHLFNGLHQRGKQIVLTSDIPPSQIARLEERLSSRFKWGLIVDLQPPDFEGRIAILKRKAEFDGSDLPEDVLYFIAQNVTSNVRDLEGALTRLLAKASIQNTEVTIELARESIQYYGSSSRKGSRVITLDDILKAVAQHFSITVEQIRGKSRQKNIARARQIAMFLAKKLTENSLVSIGRFFGDRDHSTVIHSCKIIEELCLQSGEIAEIADTLEKSLRA